MPEGSEPGRDLPAPYQDPFAALGRDLRAAAASLGLRLRELWRRNRQGELPVPGFWPQERAPLFWPLLLALGLTVLVALPTGVIRLQADRAAPAAEPPLQQPTGPADQQPTAEAPAVSVPPPAAEPEPPPLRLDPLIELLQAGDPRHLITTATPQPGTGTLCLELGSGFAQLAEPQRHSEAERWLELSQELGFGQLLLLDGSGRTLGRQARVGSGMILLDLPALR